MASFTLVPIANGNANEGTYVGGSDYQVLLSDDGNTSYVWVTRETSRNDQYYFITKLKGLVSSIDTDPSIYAKCAHNPAEAAFVATAQSCFRLGGSQVCGSQTADLGGSYTLESWLNLTRPGGGSWTPDDFKGNTGDTTSVEVKIAAGSSSNTGSDVRYSYLYVTLDATPSAGGVTYLVACFLPPMMALASHALSLADISAMVRLNWRRTLPNGLIVTPDRKLLETLKDKLTIRPKLIGVAA